MGHAEFVEFIHVNSDFKEYAYAVALRDYHVAADVALSDYLISHLDRRP